MFLTYVSVAELVTRGLLGHAKASLGVREEQLA